MIKVYAQIRYADNKRGFKEADQNDDGKVSIQEAKVAGVPEEEAKASDLDDDGKLAKADWQFVDMNSLVDSSDSAY